MKNIKKGNLFVKFLDYFFLLRIALLAPVWTIVILGWICGNSSAQVGGVFFSEDKYTEWYLWITITAFSLVVASIYVVNQIADIESDRINDKLFFLPRGLIPVKNAWICAFICAASGIAMSVIWLDKQMSIIFVLSLFLGFLYNLPPASLKNRALGGIAANFLGHDMLTFFAGWYAAKINADITQEVLMKGVLASLSAGFANAAVYITTTIADTEGDKKVGKQTFCVVYGRKMSAIAASVCCFGAVVFSFFFENNYWVMTIPSVIALASFITLCFNSNKGKVFFAFKWPVFLLSLFVTFFIPVYALLIALTFAASRVYYQWRFGLKYPCITAK